MAKKRPIRIGLLTGGGDAPGLNAVIRAVARSAFQLGWEVIGIRQGFEGLILPNRTFKMAPLDVRGILHRGGTILGTSNRANPFKYPQKRRRREAISDVSDLVIKRYEQLKLQALVVIGGDGTLSIANEMSRKGLRIVGVPKTIDNDLSETAVTFGFDTAVTTATEAIDKLHSTAESHQRVLVVEVMGRYAGWIALNSGLAGGADVILIPEIPFSIEHVCAKIQQRYRARRRFAIVVAAEGAYPKGGDRFTKTAGGPTEHEKLGGVGAWVAGEVQRRTGRETRSLVLGHLQRGGNPTTFDRLIATRFGAAAVRMIQAEAFGKMVALDPPVVKAVPLERAVRRQKLVDPSSDTVVSARQLGISFGDAEP